MRRHQLVELLLRDDHQLNSRLDADVVAMALAQQERHLAEEIPGSELGEGRAVLGEHMDAARDDDVEAVRGTAALEDDAPDRPVEVGGVADEREQHPFVERIEARYVLKGPDEAVRHTLFHPIRLPNIVGDSTPDREAT